MDFQEAKNYTLWRLAITYGAYNDSPRWKGNEWMWGQQVWYYVDIICAFCRVVMKKSGYSGLPLPVNICQHYCPAYGLCDSWVGAPGYYRFSLEGLHFFYDKLLALPMPQPKEAINGK